MEKMMSFAKPMRLLVAALGVLLFSTSLPVGADDQAEQVPADLKDWQITVEIKNGTPGEMNALGWHRIKFESNGNAEIELVAPRFAKKGVILFEGKLTDEETHKVIDAITRAINNPKAWRNGRVQDGHSVLVTLKAGQQSWTKAALMLRGPKDAAPELAGVEEVVNQHIPVGKPRI